MFHNSRHSFTARKPVGGPLGQEAETKQTSDLLTKSFRNATAMTRLRIRDAVSRIVFLCGNGCGSFDSGKSQSEARQRQGNGRKKNNEWMN